MIAARPEQPWYRGRTILVVEDHADSREILAQLLLQEGAVVLAAHDGPAALQMLEARTPDVILADVRMPGMDGLSSSRRIKANARWTQVPIIVLTALSSQADLQDTWAAGFSAHVTKPIDWEILIQTIDRVLPRDRAGPSRPRRRPRRRT